MVWKRVVFLILLLVPFVNADITTLDQLKDTYNWGDPLDLTISIIQTDPVKGLIKSTISCDDTELDYYISPFNIVENTREEFVIPTFALEDPFKGSCSLDIRLEEQSGELIEKRTIKEFIVSNDLIVFGNLDKLETSPGSTLELIGDIKKESGEEIVKTNALILLDDIEIDSIDLDEESFSTQIVLDEYIDSLAHTVTIKVSDEDGNEGTEEVEFYVTPIPTTLKILINDETTGSFDPTQDIEIKTQLFDQGGALLNNIADVIIKDPEGDKYIEGITKVKISLDQFALPGEWTIKADHEGVAAENSFMVNTIQSVLPLIEDTGVSFRNTGNIKYDNQVELILNDIRLFKELSLKVNETKTINLLGEVEDGNYSINALVLGTVYPLGDLEILDDRSTVKKIISPLTGNVIGATDSVSSFFSSAFTYFVIGILAGVAIFYYFRKQKTEYRLKHDKVAGPLKPKNPEKKEEPKSIFVEEQPQEKPSKEGQPQEEPPEDKNKGSKGLFSMFD